MAKGNVAPVAGSEVARNMKQVDRVIRNGDGDTAPLPAGYVVKLFGNDGKNTTAGELVCRKRVNGAMETVLVVNDARHPVPISDEAIMASVEGYKLELTDVDGNVHKLQGWQAASVRTFLFGIESIRGLGRNGESAATVRETLMSYLKIGGRTRSGRKAISQNELPAETGNAAADLAALKAFLIRKGAVV